MQLKPGARHWRRLLSIGLLAGSLFEVWIWREHQWYVWYLTNRVPLVAYIAMCITAGLLPTIPFGRRTALFRRRLRILWITFCFTCAVAISGSQRQVVHLPRTSPPLIAISACFASVGIFQFLIHERLYYTSKAQSIALRCASWVAFSLIATVPLIPTFLMWRAIDTAVTAEAMQDANDLLGLQSCTDEAENLVGERQLTSSDSLPLVDHSVQLQTALNRYRETKADEIRLWTTLRTAEDWFRANAKQIGHLTYPGSITIPVCGHTGRPSARISDQVNAVRSAAEARGKQILEGRHYEDMLPFAAWCNAWIAPPPSCLTISAAIVRVTADPAVALISDVPFLFELESPVEDPEAWLTARGAVLETIRERPGLRSYRATRRIGKVEYSVEISRSNAGLLRVYVELPNVTPGARAAILERYERYTDLPPQPTVACAIKTSDSDAFVAFPDRGRGADFSLIYISKHVARAWVLGGGSRNEVMPTICWNTGIVDLEPQEDRI